MYAYIFMYLDIYICIVIHIQLKMYYAYRILKTVTHTVHTHIQAYIHTLYKLYTYDMIYIPDLAYSLKREETYHILSHDNKYNLEQYMFDL